MNAQEYKDFLWDIATTLDDLVDKDTSRYTLRFHASCKEFCKKEDAYWDAFGKAQKKAEAEPQVQDYNDGTPPEKGMRWYGSSGDDTSLKGFWSNSIPFGPDMWSSAYYGWQVVKSFAYDTVKGPTNRRERLMCEYVVLGLIHDKELHDKELEEPERDPLCDIDNEEYSRLTWEMLQLCDSDVVQYSELSKHRLKRALEHVKADLAKRMTKKKLKIEPEKKDRQGSLRSGRDKAKNIKKRFSFNKAQAFFDKKDLGLPTGAEVDPAGILKKLVKSFGRIVPYKDLDENSGDTASDFLRGKIRVIRRALERHKVPCKIEPKKWAGYILSSSRTHS
jgi:hypothetical protein